MKSKENNTVSTIKYYKKMKALEIVLVLLFEVIFLCVLFFNRALRNAVFTNRYILTLCVLMWLVLITGFVFMLIDLNMLKGAASESSELSATAYTDSLTGLPNRLSIDSVLSRYSTSASLKGIGCIIMRLSNLPDMNGQYSHAVGDSIIKSFSSILKDVSSSYGFIGRNGGNEFLGIFEACDDEMITQFVADLYVALNLYNLSHKELVLEFEYAYALGKGEDDYKVSDLLAAAYHNLEEAPLT